MLVVTEKFPLKKVLRVLHWGFLRLQFYEMWHPAVLYADYNTRHANILPYVSFRRDVDEVFAVLGCNASYAISSLPRFRDSLSVPSSSVKQSKKNILLDPRRWDREAVPKSR
jgi:hypothetical protein